MFTVRYCMKIIAEKELLQRIAAYRQTAKTVVFTNGCFDILHAGHVRYLNAAKELGDILIIGLNSDSSVSALKGPTRPVNSEDDRAEVIAGLGAVDHVVIFSDDTAERLVATIKPDIYVKGGDYTVDKLPEARIAAVYGGKTVLIPEVPGRSSSNIIKKIAGQ